MLNESNFRRANDPLFVEMAKNTSCYLDEPVSVVISCLAFPGDYEVFDDLLDDE